MSDYIDTSVLVAAATKEKRTADAQSWMASRRAGSLLISDWTITEFSAALSIKLRTRQLSQIERGDALAKFERWLDEVFSILPVQGSFFREAAQFANQSGLALRAGDALHLAIAADANARVCTLDGGLFDAAKALGLTAALL